MYGCLSVGKVAVSTPQLVRHYQKRGLEPIGEYISCCHTSVAQYITMRSLFDLVVAEERQPISLATMLWW